MPEAEVEAFKAACRSHGTVAVPILNRDLTVNNMRCVVPREGN